MKHVKNKLTEGGGVCIFSLRIIRNTEETKEYAKIVCDVFACISVKKMRIYF